MRNLDRRKCVVIFFVAILELDRNGESKVRRD